MSFGVQYKTLYCTFLFMTVKRNNTVIKKWHNMLGLGFLVYPAVFSSQITVFCFSLFSGPCLDRDKNVEGII